MNKIKTGIISLAAVCLLPVQAQAQEQKRIPEYMQKRYERRMEDITLFDLNKDGVLQVDELKKGTATKFDLADTNKDGVLSPEETAAAVARIQSGEQGVYGNSARQYANRLKNRYKIADKDRDAQVSRQEYEAYMTRHQENFDRNGDGIISPEEYRADEEKVPTSYAYKRKIRD
ncbi:MAG: EF-hand domain-containing protein [Micavibrio aeruginosavorus]|nr:EF-hand domain-containing protein [Micavibrio aeruginosavorus]